MRKITAAYLYKLIIENKYAAILATISVILCIANYKSGTWLSGWDNLHPEVNFAIYWKRILQSVWQEHQGLGAVATQAHASEIPRVIILQILGIFFSVSFLRWAYVFLMLIIGPLGVYFLTLELFGHDSDKKKYSFIGGLYYLLNWGTLQHFYVELEMFVTLYGYIGWLFFFAFRFLERSKWKDLIYFAIVTFLAAPMAHTPTLWFVYMMMMGLFLLSYMILHIKNLFVSGVFKSACLLLITTFVVNAFWLMPTIYFVANHADGVADAKITRLVSEEAILNNQEYANIQSISILKGYLFNWQVFRNGSFSPIFIEWYKYLSFNNHIVDAGYAIYAVIVVGLIGSLIFRHKTFAMFFMVMVVSTFFLMMDSPPLGFVFNFLLSILPLLKEAIRFPYTKFSIPLMLVYGIFAAYGSYILSRGLHLIRPIKFLSLAPVFIITALIFIFSWPMFTGNLISDTERVNYPDDYNQAFTYLNQYQGVRVATLPAHFLFGWLYYDWTKNGIEDADYQGAGFTWFYSKNPILEREFDRWFPYNEDFYNEYQYALYSEDPDLLQYVLNKYQVNYLFYDKNIISPFSGKSLFYEKTDALLSKAGYLKLDKQVNNLYIYKVNLDYTTNAFVTAPKNFKSMPSGYDFANIDSNYLSDGEKSAVYYSDPASKNNIPFLDDTVIANKIGGTDSNVIQIYAPDNAADQYVLHTNLAGLAAVPASVNFSGTILAINYLYPQILSSSNEAIYNKQFSQYYTFNQGDQLLVNNKYIGADGFGANVLLDNANDVVVFPDKPEEVGYMGDKVNSAESSDCLGGTGGYGKELGNYPDSVILRALDKNTCLNFDTSIASEAPMVYEVQFEYKSTLPAKPLYCLYEEHTGFCLNDKYHSAPEKSLDFKKYTDYVYVPSSTSLKFSLIIETEDKEHEQSAEFRDIYLNRYPVTSQSKIIVDPSAYDQNSSKTIAKADFPLKVILPDYQNLNKDYSPDLIHYNPVPKNCDFLNQVQFDRKLLTGGSGSPYFEYTAEDAISCDSIDTRIINSNADYVITFDSSHIEGKGMDICLSATNFDKCVFQDRLKGGKESFILPSYPAAGDITLGLGNQSIGHVPTINRVSDIKVQYLPYKWLKGLFLLDAAENTRSNSIEVSGVKKDSIYMYEINTKKAVNGGSDLGLLVLDQAYENGWELYTNSCWFGIKSPLTCEASKADHVLVKNWANGWLIYPQNKGYIVIFVPQYLQFLGYAVFIVFAVTAALLVFLYKKGLVKSKIITLK